MKKILSLLLSLTLLVTCCFALALHVKAEFKFPEEFTEGDLTYIIEDGEAIVYSCDIDAAGSIAFPAAYMGCPVTTIDTYAFAWCESITEITIPASVTVIGEGAFDGCTALETVNYCGSQAQWEAIAIGADNACLTDAAIHFDAQEVPEYPEDPGVPPLPEKPEFPEDIEIPDPLPYLTYAVKGDIIKISKCDPSFNGMLLIPDQIDGYPVAEIAYWAFSGCNGIELAILPDTITTIGGGAFQNCKGLLTAYIGENAQQIMDSAFAGCESMVAVFLPASLESIGEDAFLSCDQLAAVYYSGTQEQWEQISIGSGNEALNGAEIVFLWNDMEAPEEYTDGYLTYSILDGEALVYYCDMEASGSIVIRDTMEGYPVTAIDLYSFTDCEGITSVTIPGSIVAIGEGAFDGCTALTDVYYAGSEADWEKIIIAADNDPLLQATIHYSQTADGQGDVDGVPGVDVDDAVYLLQHVLMPGQFPVEGNTDFDNSGTVDVDDAIYLLQHVLMPDQFPLK